MTESTEQNFRSGFAAVIGRPSVGKSTLVNSMLKQKIASVSPKPQTTRRRQLAIYSTSELQVVFMDTPGIHQPVHKLGVYMNRVAEDALQDADVILWLVDTTVDPTPEDKLVAEYLARTKQLPPVIILLNKVDVVSEKNLLLRKQNYNALFPSAEMLEISAISGKGLDNLLAHVTEKMPLGSPFYDPEQITDLYERDIALDLIREAVLKSLQDEVPHSVAVRLDEYSDEGEDRARISATLFVERESQKGIVIGQGGKMIKQIGTLARKEIETMIERNVYLELRVKVYKNWRDDPSMLRQLGYSTSE